MISTKPHLKRFRFADDAEGERIAKPLVEADALTLTFEGADDTIEAMEASLDSATKAPSLFAVLTKSKIDNMKAYLETKEKRLAGGNARWGGHKKPAESGMEEEGEVKKMKATS